MSKRKIDGKNDKKDKKHYQDFGDIKHSPEKEINKDLSPDVEFDAKDVDSDDNINTLEVDSNRYSVLGEFLHSISTSSQNMMQHQDIHKKIITFKTDFQTSIGYLSPLFVRWMTNSKSSVLTTTDKIIRAFTKLFYLIFTKKVDNISNYYDLIPQETKNRFKIEKLDDSGNKNTASQSLSDLISEIGKKYKDDEQRISVVLQIIDSLFSNICTTLNIPLKGDLKRPLIIEFAKSYEIIMVIDTLQSFIEASFSNDSIDTLLNCLLRNGGIPGLFYEYMHTKLRGDLLRNRKIGKSSIPKNQSGQFFTPKWITEYMNLRTIQLYAKTNSIDLKSTANVISIADISSGLGSFTEDFIDDNFRSIMKTDQKIIFSNKVNEEKGKKQIIRTEKNDAEDPKSLCLSSDIFSYDLNDLFIDIQRINHRLLGQLKASNNHIGNYIIRDTLTDSPGRSFDILVGNPPWGGSINAKVAQDPDLKRFCEKQADSYSLFLIRNILSLNNGGILYLVLPETILLNPNYSVTREYLLNNTSILEIIHLGEGIFSGINMPTVLLCIQKDLKTEKEKSKVDKEDKKMQIIRLKDDSVKKSLECGIVFYQLLEKLRTSTTEQQDIFGIDIGERNQEEFMNNPDFRFDIFTNATERNMLEKIKNSNSISLKQLVDNSRGVELGKKGEVIRCYQCRTWLSPPIWSLEAMSGENYTLCSFCKNKIYMSKVKESDKIIISLDKETLFEDTKKILPEIIEKKEKGKSNPKIIDDSEEGEVFDYRSSVEQAFRDIKHDYILIGEDVDRFFTSGENILKLGYNGIKYKSDTIYKKKKIVIRKTSDKIAATIDYEGRYTIQVVYQFNLKDQYYKDPDYKFYLEYILGVINSDIIRFYYTHTHQYVGRKNFPHHIQTNLLEIPIPVIDLQNKKDERYLTYLRIIFWSLWLMICYGQLNDKRYVKPHQLLVLDEFKRFLDEFNEGSPIIDNVNLFNWIPELFDKYIEKGVEPSKSGKLIMTRLYELAKNSWKTSIIEENIKKNLPKFEEKLNENVKKLYIG